MKKIIIHFTLNYFSFRHPFVSMWNKKKSIKTNRFFFLDQHSLIEHAFLIASFNRILLLYLPTFGMFFTIDTIHVTNIKSLAKKIKIKYTFFFFDLFSTLYIILFIDRASSLSSFSFRPRTSDSLFDTPLSHLFTYI